MVSCCQSFSVSSMDEVMRWCHVVTMTIPSLIKRIFRFKRKKKVDFLHAACFNRFVNRS